MELIETYVLRAKTRPTVEESLVILTILAKEDPEIILAIDCAIRSGSTQNRVVTAHPMIPNADVKKLIEDFIISSGGEIYLKNPGRYEVRRYSLLSADPPEETCVALVLAHEGTLTSSKSDIPEKLQEYLNQGRRWEELNSLTNAVFCYQLGLQEYPEEPELMFRLGVALSHQALQLPEALESLKKAYEARPHKAIYAIELARCYLLISDRQDIKIVGATRKELQKIALALLERASALEPNHPNLSKEIRLLRKRLDVNEEDIFFGK
jgi:tetratricopeptide (TPR) repeat protein